MLKRQMQPGTKRTASAGLWSIVDGAVVEVARWDVGPAIVAVPSESVLVLAVDLPMTGWRSTVGQRRAALPFAIEDRIAQPLDAVHVALGAEVAPRVHSAAVVGHAPMTAWTALVDAAGLGHAALVPDALLLPVPPMGWWSVAAADGRVRVRTDAGGGFAVADADFVAAWTAGGQLPCAVYGAPLPVDLPADRVRAAGMPALAPVTLDLRQGAYAAPGRRTGMPRRVAAILAVGLVAHAAIAAAGTIKLRADAGAQRVVTTARDPAFLPLLARMATAVAPVGGVALTRLRFDGRGLTITVAGDPAPARRALAAAGGPAVARGAAA